jgi:hypothetical protein
MLREQGNLGELRRRDKAGDVYARSELARLLREQGNVEEAIAVLGRSADAGNLFASRELAGLLREQGNVEELRRRAEAGDETARSELERLLRA